MGGSAGMDHGFTSARMSNMVIGYVELQSYM